jgi:hypothetical protein
LVGYHQASVAQLFAVVEGSGWISSGEQHVRQPISSGGAVLWSEGEWHEVETEGGLVAIVVEGAQLAPRLSYENAAPNGS